MGYFIPKAGTMVIIFPSATISIPLHYQPQTLTNISDRYKQGPYHSRTTPQSNFITQQVLLGCP